MVAWCVWVCVSSYFDSWSQDSKEVEANQKPMAADRALRFNAAFQHMKHGLKHRQDWCPPAMIKMFHDHVGKAPLPLTYVYFWTFLVHRGPSEKIGTIQRRIASYHSEFGLFDV